MPRMVVSSKQLYAYPKLGGVLRNPFVGIASPGLGNCLFPYARAIVFCKKNNAQLIWPEWFQINIGSILRREAVSRNYSDNFCACAEDLVFPSKQLKLLSSKMVEESAYSEGQSGIVVFSGMQEWFKPLNLSRPQLIPEMMLRHKGDFIECSGKIGIHYRRGDFRSATFDELYSGVRNIRTPDEWFVAMIKKATKLYPDSKFAIFSDATENEIMKLSTQCDFQIINGQSAFGDMLSLSTCNVIIGSRSTFTLWAYFLGNAELWLPFGSFVDPEFLPISKRPITFARHDEI